MDGEPIYTKTGEEASKENISQVLFSNLRLELGEQNFEKHQYVTDILKLRADVNPLLEKGDKTAAVAKVRESRMWNDYSAIQTETFTPEELKQIAQLDYVLQNRAIAGPLKTALIDFLKYRHTLSWEKRPPGVRADEAKKKEKTDRAVQHLTDVADFTEKMNASPIATLLALIHDVEKYAGEETLLAEHEVASAVIGGEILQTLFQSTALLQDKNLDISAYAGVMNKLARKVFSHGEYEFPDLNAQPITDAKEDENIRTLFRGINPRPFGSSKIHLRRKSSDAITKEDLLVTRILESVSIADKHIGIKDMDKVVDEIAGPKGENLKDSPWSTFEGLSNTVIENSIAADIVGALDQNSDAYKQSRRWRETNLFILYLIKRTDELHLNKEPGYENIYSNAFHLELQPGEEGTDQQKKALINQLEELIFTVQSMRTLLETDDQQPIFEKNIYQSLFHSLYESLHSIPFSIVENSELSKDLAKFEADLANKWVSAHPALMGKS